MHHAHSTYQLIYCSATVTGKNKQNKALQTQWYTIITLFSMIILIYSQNCFLSQVFRLCGALCTTYFIWSSGKRGRSSVGYGLHGPYYKVPRQLTKNTGSLLRPTFGTHILPPMAKAFVIWAKQKSMEIILEIWKCIPPTVGEAM